ncbi:MAG: FUSC family protein, partial [Gaiellaceae bacterium]
MLSALSRGRRRLSDPELASLKSAARAAIVMPAVFAFADKVIANSQTATFAAFGSFAMLVLAEFTGRPRARLTAYLALGLVGAVLVVIGTLFSRNAWLGAGAMLVVGFMVLYAGLLGGRFAAGGTAAILAFVLPVTIAAPLSSIPARLEGWGLAAGAGICAVMLLWPARPRGTLRFQAARDCLGLADLADAKLAGDRAAIEARAQVTREAVHALRRGFLGTAHRPTGPTGPTAALAALVDELDWLLSFLVPAVEGSALELCPEENAEALAATIAVLRASAATLEGRSERPDLDRLDAAHEAVAQALLRRISELPRDEDLESVLEPSFRIRVLSYAARQVAAYALLATGADPPELADDAVAGRHRVARPAREALQATEQLAVEHASARSVWFRNSIRGAVGLALAVFIAQRTGLQHAFWVVLGTLSVLRSNALATGSSIVSALVGTAVGILVGAALVIAIGTHETVLWAVLPVAVLLAAYAPRAISFAAGQAGFTVVLFVLFNLIQPTGWKVGVVRIEDVAIGFAISLGVGLLFWPRGAESLLR